MENFLLNIDFFGEPISFTYRNKRKFQSKLGGIITIIISLLAITLIYGLGQNFFRRRNPKFSKEDVSHNVTPFYNINNLNFSIAFKIENNSGEKISSKKLFMQLSEERVIKKNDDEIEYQFPPSEIIKLKNCTEDLFPDKELFKSKNLALYQCPILNNTIGGSYSESMIRFLYLGIVICKDGKKNDR